MYNAFQYPPFPLNSPCWSFCYDLFIEPPFHLAIPILACSFALNFFIHTNQGRHQLWAYIPLIITLNVQYWPKKVHVFTL